MMRAGLTGGMACGKSVVAAMFGEMGAHVLQADTLAHKLYQPGEPVYQEVVKRFGQEIIQPDGTIDRKRLAALAFDGGRVEELNRIVHPAVLRRQEQWMFEIRQKEPHAVVMVEAALIFEAGAARQFDKVIVVTCRPEQKVARLAQRAGISEEEARAEMERRSKAQLSDEEKIRRASYVIDNSGSLDRTRNQVQRVFWELKTLALRSY
ncbi:MAG TPA: dephospho-CoA kinase [Candidatus Angelobacter sp.]|nr:dephospho-CoA kinase [Candidatus Angelobacter sp.]